MVELDQWCELHRLLDTATASIRIAREIGNKREEAKQLLERAWVEMCFRDFNDPNFVNGTNWSGLMWDDIFSARALERQLSR